MHSTIDSRTANTLALGPEHRPGWTARGSILEGSRRRLGALEFEAELKLETPRLTENEEGPTSSLPCGGGVGAESPSPEREGSSKEVEGTKDWPAISEVSCNFCRKTRAVWVAL